MCLLSPRSCSKCLVSIVTFSWMSALPLFGHLRGGLSAGSPGTLEWSPGGGNRGREIWGLSYSCLIFRYISGMSAFYFPSFSPAMVSVLDFKYKHSWGTYTHSFGHKCHCCLTIELNGNKISNCSYFSIISVCLIWILMFVLEMDLKSTSQKATLKEEIMMYFVQLWLECCRKTQWGWL